MDIKILSGGAANGLVTRLTPTFNERTGTGIIGDFGAVGGMRDRILKGEAVDLMILTRAVIDRLVEEGHAEAGSVADIGKVVTGVAVREGEPVADVSTAQSLGAALATADAIYLPDPDKATAGIHFAKVITDLGLMDTVASRLRRYPNGQTAMAAMAESTDRRPIGCTQVTEILNTPGVDYCGALPDPHGLVTTYTAALSTGATNGEIAGRFIQILRDPTNSEAREACGFSR